MEKGKQIVEIFMEDKVDYRWPTYAKVTSANEEWVIRKWAEHFRRTSQPYFVTKHKEVIDGALCEVTELHKEWKTYTYASLIDMGWNVKLPPKEGVKPREDIPTLYKEE